MVEADAEDFSKGEAGGSGVERVAAGDLKKGDLCMIKGHPCKVVNFSTAKVGKHGSAKAMVTGIDIFTSNKYEATFGSGDMIDAPITKRVEYSLLNIDDDGYLSLLTDSGETKEDVQLPTDDWLKDVVSRTKQIFEAGEKECLVTVLAALGQEKVIAVREGKDND